jgi:FkbM family methyltransferase
MKNYYAQYKEDEAVSKFINDSYVGNILDIGANDGKTLSNSLHFIENGWGATLIEASPIAFEKITSLHKDNDKVQSMNICLANVNKKFKFYHNVTHLKKNDTDLLSTISEVSYADSVGSGNPFTSFEIDCFRFDNIKTDLKYKTYDVISIDIEGYDYEVLSQMNLTELGCKILIIEYNRNNDVKNKIINHCASFGLRKIILDNTTNIIIAL